MLIRVLLAAVVSMALIMAGAGHAVPAMAGEGKLAAAADVADHDQHDGRGDHDAAPETGKSGCADHCIGCSFHCPAMALSEERAELAGLRPATRLTARHERCDSGLVAAAERPPRTV